MPGGETKRLFVAAFPPPVIAKHLKAAMAELSGNSASTNIRWTRPEQIHLTLFFLGSVPSSRIAEIQSALQKGCASQSGPAMTVSGLGCFPSATRPRVLWAGIGGELRPLEKLQQSIASALLNIDFQGEYRPFHPHVTLGRVGDTNRASREQIAGWLNVNKGRSFGDWELSKVSLMQSLTLPSGASYSELGAIPLQP
jgi:2'-5' RNA ligase